MMCESEDVARHPNSCVEWRRSTYCAIGKLGFAFALLLPLPAAAELMSAAPVRSIERDARAANESLWSIGGSVLSASHHDDGASEGL